MTVASNVVVIDDMPTPALLATGPCSGSLYTTSSQTVLIGGDFVSGGGNNFPLLPGVPFTFRLEFKEALYGQASDAASIQVHVITMTTPIDYDAVLLPMQPRIGEVYTGEFLNGDFQAAIFFLTAQAAGTGSLTLGMEALDPVTLEWGPYIEWANLLQDAGEALGICDPAADQAAFDLRVVVKKARLPHRIRLRVSPSNLGVEWTYGLGVTVMR